MSEFRDKTCERCGRPFRGNTDAQPCPMCSAPGVPKIHHHRAIVFALELARDRLSLAKSWLQPDDYYVTDEGQRTKRYHEEEVRKAQEAVDFLEGLVTQTVAMLDGHLVGFYASQPPGTKFWFSVEDMEEGHEPDTVVPGGNDNYVMILAGPAPEERCYTEFIGCRHPAWPDPLSLRGPKDAERWYREHVGEHPDIFVDRIAHVRTRFLGKKTEDG